MWVYGSACGSHNGAAQPPSLPPFHHHPPHFFWPMPMRLNNSLTAVCLPFVIGEAFLPLSFSPPQLSASFAAFASFGGRKIAEKL